MYFSLASYATALVSLASVSQTLSAQIDVVVGGPGVLKYTPSSVTANVGDVVVFSFQQKNHTVTQSTLENPCTPAPGGFDSGFVFVDPANTAGPFQTATFTVKDTNPVWVYCRQATHCTQGMVFAINAGDKFAQFQSTAMGGSAAPSSTDPYGGGASPSATPPATTTPPTTASTTDHKVIVGGPGKLVYDPSRVTAQVGDTVTFEFHQKNHTATQSSFGNPCRSLTLTSLTGQIALDSGFMAVADTATAFPTWTIQVNDTAPLWFYCKQATHCGQGMVFAVNSDESSSNSFAAFQAKAKALNGTATPPAGITPNGSNGAGRAWTAGNGLLLAVAGVVFGLVL